MEPSGEWAIPRLEIQPFTVENAPVALRELIGAETPSEILERRRKAKAKKERLNGA